MKIRCNLCGKTETINNDSMPMGVVEDKSYYGNHNCSNGETGTFYLATKQKPNKEFKDGVWYKPKMKGFIHECCDCGLKHKIDFKVFYDDKENPIEFRWNRVNTEQKPNNLSLCQSCMCMTKTINGVCGKCKETKPNNSDWQERFKGKFKDEPFGPSNYTHYFNESRIYQQILDFISSELKIEREKVLKEVEGIMKKLMDKKRCKQLADNLELFNGQRSCKICGYNPEKQRHELLSKINSLIKK